MWPVVLGAGAVAALGWLLSEVLEGGGKGSPLVFVSYNYERDKHYKRLLTAWAANGKFNLQFSDHSVDISVNSGDRGVVRRVVSQRIREADVFLCIIGPDTALSEWVNWEIDKAYELNRPIIAVKVNRSYETPAAIYNCGARWVYSFSHDKIVAAIREVR
jgi:hypothetical protein